VGRPGTTGRRQGQGAGERTSHQLSLKAYLQAGADGRESIDCARHVQVRPPTCGSCDEVLSRPAACLSCSFVGCLSSTHGKGAHLHEHGRKLSHAFGPSPSLPLILEQPVLTLLLAALGVDSFSGAVHCAECHDFVTSAVLRKERRLVKIQEETRVLARKQGASSVERRANGRGADPTHSRPVLVAGAKRKRPAALAWEPNEAEADALQRTTPLGCRGQ
jgi:hypothetical protein